MELLTTTTNLYLLTCIPVLLCIAALLKTLSLKKQNKLLLEQLSEATLLNKLSEENFAELSEKHARLTEFQNSLNEAKLKTKLQKPRLNAQASEDCFTPEKYSYVHSLTKKGLSAEEIGSILAMSPHEASQLVALSKIAQGT